MDAVFNFNLIQTPEKPDTTFYERKIFSREPIFLKDIDFRRLSFFYLLPGETYKVTLDSGFSRFEVVNYPERTAEVNVLRELRKHHKRQNRFDTYDLEENYGIRKFYNMPLAFRDSLLQEDYKANLRFLDSYASKHGFSDPVRQRYARYLLFRYHAARLDFTMKDPGKAKAFLKENGAIHGDAAKLVNCDTCFAFPDYPYLTKLFAKAFVADPASQPVDALYKAYAAFFTGKAKDYLLYDLIKAGGMFNRTRPNPALAERFLSDAKDPALKNYIKETYAFLALKKSEKGLLAGVSGAPVSWSQLLEKHKGKVIYVDFWASWCAPCRSEMPASHDLQKQFAGKEVVFVYVSLDENSVDWKKASHAERIHNGERFIITQPEKFDLGKAYRITSIPRYFLIDKSGKIVNDNASRPSDQQIVKEIQLLL